MKTLWCAFPAGRMTCSDRDFVVSEQDPRSRRYLANVLMRLIELRQPVWRI